MERAITLDGETPPATPACRARGAGPVALRHCLTTVLPLTCRPQLARGDGDEILCLNGPDVRIIRRERKMSRQLVTYLASACGLCPRLTRPSDYREASAVATALMLMSTLDPRIG